ncbi:MAG TPA: DUF5916 domain-containing protein [Gemmatimonadota bacterium]|nr:DUF5916 domain-containing protein [Gemmatimonadota bacterium]
MPHRRHHLAATLAALVLGAIGPRPAGATPTAAPRRGPDPSAAATAAPAFVRADTTGPTYRGDRGRTEVRIPRLELESRVDGQLDEPAWRRAAVLTGFTRYLPQDGPPAEDSTRVLVWYSNEALHVGIEAFEVHGPVGASRSARDRIGSDDRVRLLIDTEHASRRAYAFGVNAFGVQEDGIRVEGTEGKAGLFDADRSAEPADLTPDFQYESRGRLVPGGYVVEIRIPFSSLRFSSDRRDWGLNVVRRVPHSGRELTWAPVHQGETSFLAQEGTLTGLSGLHRSSTLDVNPVATARMQGAPAAAGWSYGDPSPDVGLNLRYGVTSDLSLNATYNPDFSQVETDAGQLSYDPRQALYFPEKRPFFLEGSERFSTPNRLVYTRRIDDPVVATKLSGSVAGFSTGVLSALNRPSPGDLHRSVFNVLRAQADVGSESTVGLLYTDRLHGVDYNHVAAADTRLVLGDAYVLSAQAGGSVTKDGGSPRWGPLWDVSLERSGRSFGATASFRAISPDFVTDAGFLSRTGVAHASASPRLTFFGSPSSPLESATTSVVVYGDWLYDDLFGGRGPEALKLHLNADLAFRSGWRTGASVLFERFYYPPYLYADYAIERTTPAGTDTIPFTGTPSIPNLDVVLRTATPHFDRFDAGLTLILGRDENFYEWAPAYIFIANASMNWKPTDRLHFGVTYSRQQYLRFSDRSNVAIRDLPRLKVTYQVTRALYVRLIGEYDSNFRDALRDDTRTGDPILRRDPDTGTYRRTVPERSGRFHTDALFAIQPSPGTALFVGYGTDLQGARRFQVTGLDRTADVFFVKLSYLFRM